MSGVIPAICGAIACACGGIAVGCGVSIQGKRRFQTRRRRIRRNSAAGAIGGNGINGADGTTAGIARASPSRDINDRIAEYAEQLSRRLLIGETSPLTPSVRAKRAGRTRAGMRFVQMSAAAGCAKTITVSAYCETRTRFTVVGLFVGALIGVIFSTELAIVLAIVGALVGRMLPARAMRAITQRRALEAEQLLSEMLEVVALGLRSGLTFDRSFALYGSHFESGFARSCTKAYRSWSLGLMTREEALREFAASYDCDQLARVVESIIRSLRFGSSFAGLLEDAARESRQTYRAVIEERVAKAPVKMMLPTATLILPAMLLLVIGPILLELAAGF